MTKSFDFLPENLRNYPQFTHLRRVSGNVWPKILDPKQAQYIQGLSQLENSQWLTPDDLASRQLSQLHILAQHAFHQCDYHKAVFKDVGFDATQPFTWEDWRKLPLLRRQDVQKHMQALLAHELPTSQINTSWVQTSGSTGEPVKVRKNNLSGYMHRLLCLRETLWAKRDLSKTLVGIRATHEKAKAPQGIRNPKWGGIISEIFHTGPSGLLGVDCNIADQIRWISDIKPEYLMIYPNCLLAIMKAYEHESFDLSFIKGIATIGEMVSPDLRTSITRNLGINVIDCYSSQEIGYMALQCPEHDHLHIQSENVLLEVLNQENQPCEAGEIGRIVVTNLHNFSMPLLRYEIGDWAEVGAACPCGRGLPVLNKIVGRSRNMMRLKDGNTRWPMIGFAKYHDIAPIRQHQIIQTGFDSLIMKLVIHKELDSKQQTQMRALLCKSLNHDFHIEFQYFDELKVGKNGKFEEFISVF